MSSRKDGYSVVIMYVVMGIVDVGVGDDVVDNRVSREE